MTTIDQENIASSADDSRQLGDCILHLTHHHMESECWNALIRFYADNMDHSMVTKAAEQNTNAMRNQAMVNFYKYEYEQRLLNRFMRTGEL